MKKINKKKFRKKKTAVSRPSTGNHQKSMRRFWDGLQARLETVAPVKQDEPDRPEPGNFFRTPGGFQAVACMRTAVEILGRVRCEGGQLYRHGPDHGIWKMLDDAAVGNVVLDLLGERGRKKYVDEVISLMRIRLRVDAADCLPDPSRVTLANCVIHLASGKRQAFSHAFNHKVKLPFAFDHHAKCPLWLRTLDQIFDGDAERIELIQQIYAYCLVPGNEHQVFFLFIGSGSNGKGVASGVLRSLVGAENTCAVPADKFDNDFMLATLRGKSLNLVSEVNTARAMPSSVLKALTSQDEISVNVKYKDPVTFRPSAIHVFCLNEMPKFADRSYGLRRRVMIVNFDRTFSPEERDPNLAEKLEAELPGIFNWARQGLKSLQKHGGFLQPKACRNAIADFELTQNPVMAFIRSRCTLVAGDRVRRTFLYSHYTCWHDEEGLPGKPISRSQFFKQLKADNPSVRSLKSGGLDYFLGITIKTKKKKVTVKGKRGGKSL